MKHHAVCPVCKAVVACSSPTVTLAGHYVHGNPCPGSHTELCPENAVFRPLSFRERFPDIHAYAASCRPLWQAVQEDEGLLTRKEE